MPKAKKPLILLDWPARIFILALVALSFGLLIHPMGDPDVYIHLRDGRYWLEQNLHVTTDPFSYTASEKPFDQIEVLFKIGIYALYSVGSYPLVILVKALLMTAAIGLLGILIYRRWPLLGLTAGLLAWGVLGPLARFLPERPFVFTYLFLPWVLLLLENYRNSDPDRAPRAEKQLWIIPALVVPWANLHPGFMVLFVFLGGQFLEYAFNWFRTRDNGFRRKTLTLASIGAAAAAAGLLNPLGAGLYQYVLRHLASSEFMEFITEWASPTLQRVPFFYLLLVFSWVVHVLSIRNNRWGDLIPLAVFSYLAVRSYRNIILFVIAALPPLAGQLRMLWMEWAPKDWRWTPATRSWGLWGGVGLSVGLLVLATTQGYALRIEELPHIHPQLALQWLQQHPVQGRIFAHDRWGGYLTWKTHGRMKVFMDGRLEMFGLRTYGEYRSIIYGEPNAPELLKQYAVQGLLISPQNEPQFFQRLRSTNEWALVYWDHVAMLYLRRHGPNQSLIDAWEYKTVDPSRAPSFFDPQRIPQVLDELQRAHATTPASYLPLAYAGVVELVQGNANSATAAFQQALVLAPRHFDSMYNLGLIAFRQGRLEAAERYTRQALQLSNQSDMRAQTCHLLAVILKPDPLRHREALDWARRAAILMPDWPAAQGLVRELELQP